ncbi:chromate transporter [Neobacillus niacini]|uniref:chromate transporter n=1 Tax=Neobacillus niacini TaxID=86668 RepID=UPI0021CB870F|nr:chromate transporter [Neobacillus niacini]MCM3767724.1 chromate transporter [Neobacillus niacini]
MNSNIRILIKLFFTFLKISPITFGGGYAMTTLIELEVVNKNKWIKKEEIIDVFTIAQTLPGAVAINSAIFIGYRVAGLLGAVISLIGILFPTFSIVILVSLIYFLFKDNPLIKAAFNGIGASIIALILYAGITIGKSAIKGKTSLFLTILSLLLLIIFHINPILLIIGGAFIGMFKLKHKSVGEEGREIVTTEEQKAFYKES